MKRHSSFLIHFQRSLSSKETIIHYSNLETMLPAKIEPLDFAGLEKNRHFKMISQQP